MRTNLGRVTAFLLLFALALAVTACSDDPGTATAGATSDRCPAEGEPFEGDVRLFIEHNATDQDTGVHGEFGHDGLVVACLRSPEGEELLRIEPHGRLADLGINDFFFESREPTADEYPVERLREDFPEGEYTVAGVDREGTPRAGTARFTHAIPAAPVVTAPGLADEESARDVVVPTSDLVVRWEPVTETVDGDPVDVVGYEVIVTQAEYSDPDAMSLPVYDVHLGPQATELPVADGFLQPGTVHELEVLALEDSGNQTISLGFFTTAR